MPSNATIEWEAAPAGDNGIIIFTSAETFKFRVGGVDRIDLTSNQLQLNSNSITQVDHYETATGIQAQTGVFRTSNTQLLSWRNAGNTADISISVNAADNFLVNSNFDINNNDILNAIIGSTNTIQAGAYDALSIVNADISASAAILQSKLEPLVVGDLPNLPILGTLPASPRQLNIVNAEIDAGAAILQSKLAPLVNGDLPNLPILGTLPASPRQLAIVNAEIDAGAAIAYSKLNLTGLVVNADIAAAAAIIESKLSVAVGVSGTVLTSNGVGSAPTYQTAAGGGDMLLAGVQTVTGAKTFEDGTFILRNPADTFSMTILNAAIASALNLSMPVITVNDTLVAVILAQTLQNKTLTDFAFLESDAANPSGVGALRLGNAQQIGFRNAANDGDWTLELDSLNRLNLIAPAINAIVRTAFTSNSVAAVDATIFEQNIIGNDDGSNPTTYVRISAQTPAIGNTLEEGKLIIAIRETGGVLTPYLRFNDSLEGTVKLGANLDLDSNTIINAIINSTNTIQAGAYDALSIVNADISATAAILQSKLAPLVVGDLPNLPILGTLPASPRQLNIVNAEIDAGAAILQSKLAPLVNGDLPNLPVLGTLPASPRQLAIVNAEIDASAAIAYSKLNLTGLIVNADINASAAILQSKLADLVVADLPDGSAFQRYRTNSAGTAIELFTENAEINFIMGDGSGVITTGIKVFIRLPYDCEVERWTVLSKDASSSIVVDINRYTSLANYDAGTKASIAGSDLPTLSSDKANESTSLTGWTTVLNQGDILEAEVDSITTATRVTVGLRLNKRG